LAEGDVERKKSVPNKNADCAWQVVVPFYTACGECFYCVRGQASRCSKGMLLPEILTIPTNN
jgi:threonine dehydrogenase-like Zn-dependent dehydrogenase